MRRNWRALRDCQSVRFRNIFLAALLVVLVPVSVHARPASPLALVLSAEARRIETIERIAPSVVCVFDSHRRGGGSGVLIDPQGYGLTNYHVAAGLLDKGKGWGGLADGVLYELEVLGIDVAGDVAMFRLIPPKAEFAFPYARLGDSDEVQVGDTAIAVGNPFSLSEDYTPTVTLGIVTGVHRYQWGVGGNLAYTDCIQVDAPINPGNSGGPLFNAVGEIIGINGRISVNRRGRFNVGFGYAISANQIKRFIPALRAGLLARHGTWQARVEGYRLQTGDPPNPPLVRGGRGGVRFAEVRQSGPAYEAGLREGDELLWVDGVRIQTANQVASILGTYPAGWPVQLQIAPADGELRDVIVKLEAVQPKMRRPFKVDREANLRQVKRVLRAFRRAALGNGTASRPKNWKWTAVRHPLTPRDSQLTPGEPDRFEVSQSGAGPIRMRQRYEDGSTGRLIEYDENTAVQRIGDEEESYDLPPDVKMILGALYTMQRWLLEPVDDIDLTEVAHAGGEALVEPIVSMTAATRRESESGSWWVEPALLEVLEWPLTDGAVAMFAFDSETFAIVRVTVRDLLSGAQATIDLSDHRDVGGVVWPCAMEVHAEGNSYCETLSNWELTP